MKFLYGNILCLLLLTFCTDLLAQEDTTHINKYNYLKSRVIEGDTLPHVYIGEVTISPPWKFKSKRQHKRYSRLVINVKKTLPYARLAKYRLTVIANTLDTLPNERAKKLYLKKAEKELFEEFEKPLRKLTFSQGRMLIKLIDRETGDTSYDLIKDLKGGFSAFMWQSVARIFGSNLKSEFDSEGDDAMIEHIVIMIDNGML
ncbi:DUF4294 domain-containing protein [Plebeiibacterium sediminum]|uniref:DUF4294 domain-containing protein n=1 Tax=Plebeiibacterium sediminum TaxID=2992112 RepID=A0AAE3M799_9BACT|nr:DUF4294 domain-containing protein [Plebeiobacterium sediminum]MCW3788564.1 DUF4294 domain-containing protein [Plebeiobacterium sediminum]